MSQSSQQRVPNRRVNSLQNELNGRTSREGSRTRRKSVSYNDAYLYALRVAYLSYLLQPRSKRKRHVTKPSINRNDTTASFNELMKDFTLVANAKSVKLPNGFIKELEKRLQGILMGRERRPEYQDRVVKQSMAVYLNTLSEPGHKKRMEESRRAEDLVLIFFSNATKELQKGHPPGDDSVKRMVDRHVALFVRLLGLILKDHSWAAERPELTSRLATLEKKLLKHDEDLTTQSNGTSTLIEEVIPLSYEVKDMPMVLVVGRIFGLRPTMMQSDIAKHKDEWTEKAALQDLKTYQSHLNMGTRRTLSSDDFDTHQAYETWKTTEAPDLSKMILAIMQVDPELAKTTGASAPINASHNASATDSAYSDMGRVLSQNEDNPGYVLDMPDLAGLSFMDSNNQSHDDHDQIYTFIPPDPRSMFRFILLQCLNYDLNDRASSDDANAPPPSELFSKQSKDLLYEIGLRWRIPRFSRSVLFLDVVKEKFIEQGVTLEILDGAFNHVKEPPVEDNKNKRESLVNTDSFSQRELWTVADFAMMRKLLSDIYHALLRDLYEVIMSAYDDKAQLQRLGAVMTVLDEHIRNDHSFSQSTQDFENFKRQATTGLEEKAREIYGSSLEKQLPTEPEKWEFYHVQQLATSVLKLAEKIQKRFKRNPEILGINPLMILLSVALPAFAEDSKAMVEQIIDQVKKQNLEVPIQDGFDLYKELSEFRRVHADALPQQPFPYKVEDLLADFVWRWIRATEDQIVGWIQNAVAQDQFKVRTRDPGQVPNEDERHSVSVIDIFRSFTQVVDQIAQLNWDDDLTYAKFMTAISKAVGNGINRYCEIADLMFSKEMDRMTPEQEAAASMTRQEKWMQLARDTISNTSRVEPFQFYSESFVKLNNISFAIQHWDKLEKEINVDACAEVIKRYNPPAMNRPRRTTNYVFTIKIVEGEDLKSCDVNGYSDPYVVITDDRQKRLSKTRVIYRNLNPRWDESIDISTQGALNLIATIWDWDAIGDHDYVGRTSLKLDPSHFGDFLPREYWLDLDTQGRLLVRVSMEGERDDIQFYFGKAFRTLQRTQRDMTRKVTDKLSAYINHCLSRRALRALLNRGISVTSVTSYFNRSKLAALAQQPMAQPTMPSEAEIVNALKPLFTYFDDNFAIMNQTLTSSAMTAVMTRLWKEVLATIESLLVPPLSDKPSAQKPLDQIELDVVFKWLQALFDFFNAVDPDTGQAEGVPTSVLKSPKYHEIQTLNFFYFETTENLIRTSERMASATAASQQANRSRLSAPPAFGSGSSLLQPGAPAPSRRAKSIMLSRNLGTMRKAKEEKWKAAQAEPSDDMILRILRMRGEAGGYLRDRSRQKERLAAAAAAEMIVRQSLLSSGGRMTGPSVIKRH